MRFAIVIALLIGVFTIPWWVMITALLVSVVLFRRFYAALIPAVLMDAMHGGVRFVEEPLQSATLIVALALLLLHFLEMYLRDHVRF